MNWIDWIGILPAVIFPTATLIQLLHLLRVKSAEGVSALSWVAFCLGNLSLYLYTEKYGEWQAIVGLLGTSLLQVWIIVLVVRYRKPGKQ